MFDHSIKVPRLYKTASKIAREVSEGKGSIKQLVYECKHPNIKALYALVVHVYQRTDDIENLLRKSKLLIKEPRFDPWLAKVLITELIWGKQRLSSQSKPVMTILAYEQIFKAHLSDNSTKLFEDVEQVDKPRYVRINTLKITINEAVEAFRDEGWVLKRYTDSDYSDFLKTVENLGPEEFMIDFHIPYLLIFPSKTQFYKHPAYKNGDIILQDKASCLPVHILSPEPGSNILDMCAAPGMKTTQCAAIIQNKGHIVAVEIGKKRFETLNKMIEASGATCINAVNADVLTLTGKDYPNIEYILVDPSCSGSGITDRIEIGQQEMDQNRNRLGKLAGFQIKILRHALTKFPNVKKVVYSTCSVYPEENEDVIRQVLETCLYFKLVPANQFVNNQWINFGSPDFGDIGNYCLYAKPDIDLTSGFFVAVFERLEDGERNQFLNHRLYSQKMEEWRQKKRKEEGLEDKTETKKQKLDIDCLVNDGNSNMETKSRRKKKVEPKIEMIEESTVTVKEEIENVSQSDTFLKDLEPKIKKKKIKIESFCNESSKKHIDEERVDNFENIPDNTFKRKKKKKLEIEAGEASNEALCDNIANRNKYENGKEDLGSIDVQPDNTLKKKKKKKKREVEAVEAFYEIQIEKEPKRNKKNVNESDRQVEPQEEVIIEQKNDVIKKKKKKKERKGIGSEGVDSVCKEKKEDRNDSLLELPIDDIGKQVGKKFKIHNMKESEVDNNIVGETVIRSEKKKKKKKQEIF